MTLRSAIIISSLIHACIFAPFYNQNFIRQAMEKKNTVVVDYVILKEIAAAITTNKEVTLKTPETPSIDVQKQVAPAPQIKTDTNKEALKKKAEARKVKEDAAKKEKELKSKKDYINYYQLIREKIRARLKNNYSYYNREGDVYLTFTLASNGTLQGFEIDRARSTRDEVLLHITAASLKAVSPFPPIPKTLAAPKMTFSIAISFKK